MQNTILSGTINNAIITLGNIDDSGKGRHFVSRFIKDGLVKIEGHGVVLLKKETLDASLPSMIGTPVIIRHQDVTKKNADKLRCGTISNAYFNEPDGWYYCEGIIWDEDAQELIENQGWSVSCSYDFLSYNDEGGVENNIPYDKEFTQLNFTHLALVDNPRYERANIVFNCKVDNDRWITIKPHGDESDDYRRLKLEDGETPKEAIDRTYGKDETSDTKEKKKERTFIDKKTGKEQSLKDLVEKGLTPVRYSSSLWENKPSYGIGDGKIEYKITEEEYKQALEHQKDKKSTDLKKAKEQSKDLTDYIKWQYNADIEPHITRRVGDKTLVEWDKLPRETQSALKRLDFDDKVNLEQYSSYEMSINVKDKKIFENLEKHRQHISEQKQPDTKDKQEPEWLQSEKQKLDRQTTQMYEDRYSVEHPEAYKKNLEEAKNNFSEGNKGYSLSKEYKNHVQFEDDKESGGYPRKIHKDLESAKKFYEYKKEGQEGAEKENLKRNGKRGIPLRDYPVIVKNPMGEGYIVATSGLAQKHNLTEVYPIDRSKANNSKEQDMALLEEIKKLISKVENSKENDMEIDEKIENEAVDKRKLIDEVAGIMKSAGCDDEDIRTAIGKMEKIGYDKSEAGSADNKKVKNEEPDEKDDKKVENEDEKDKKEVKDLKDDMKKDVDNKCKNSKEETSTFDKINAIYNSIKLVKEESKYTSRQEKLDAAKEYFS